MTWIRWIAIKSYFQLLFCAKIEIGNQRERERECGRKKSVFTTHNIKTHVILSWKFRINTSCAHHFISRYAYNRLEWINERASERTTAAVATTKIWQKKTIWILKILILFFFLAWLYISSLSHSLSALYEIIVDVCITLFHIVWPIRIVLFIFLCVHRSYPLCCFLCCISHCLSLRFMIQLFVYIPFNAYAFVLLRQSTCSIHQNTRKW